MTISSRTTMLSLMLALLCGGAHAQTEDKAAAMRKALHVDSYKNIDYFDENKKPITSQQFDDRVRAGAHVSMAKKTKDGEVSEVKMYLQAKEEKAVKPKYKIKPGDDFPDFSLTMLTDQKLDRKALMGRYTIISFYFAECAPCIDEVPELNAFAEGREDMNYLAMTFDPLKVSRKFVQEHKFAWTVLSDAHPTLSAIGVNAYPTFALLDPKGKLIAIEPAGAIKTSDKSLAAWVARLAPQARN